MHSSSTLIKISRPTLDVKKKKKKKSELIKDSQNIFAYFKEPEQSEALANKLGLFQIQLGGLGEHFFSLKIDNLIISCVLLSLL